METTNNTNPTALSRVSVSTALAPISADLNDLAKVINQPPAALAVRVAEDFAKIAKETGLAVPELVEQALALAPAHRSVALDHLSFGATPAAIGLILEEVDPHLQDPAQVNRDLMAHRRQIRDAGEVVPDELIERHDQVLKDVRNRYKSAGATLSDVLNLMQSESDEGRLLIGADTEPVIAPEELAKVLARLIRRFGAIPSTDSSIGDREGISPFLGEAYAQVGELAKLFGIAMPFDNSNKKGWDQATHQTLVAFVLLLDRLAADGSTQFDPRSVEELIDNAAEYAKAEGLTGKLLFAEYAGEEEDSEEFEEDEEDEDDELGEVENDVAEFERLSQEGV